MDGKLYLFTRFNAMVHHLPTKDSATLSENCRVLESTKDVGSEIEVVRGL